MHRNIPRSLSLQFRARSKQAPFVIRRKRTHRLSIRCHSTSLARSFSHRMDMR